MPEAARQFRRVNGHLHLPALRTALERGELALGHLARRSENWGLLHNLPQATVATDLEVLTLIDNQTCWGWASVRRRAPDGRDAAETGSRLWTRDKRLAAVAAQRGLTSNDARGS